jgi:hypothetical protein
MASNINPYNVDGTFPVAGQDNSSQGFRNNFTNIKNNFIFAQNELTDLQNKAIVTSALGGQPLNNDMAGTQIIRPQLAAWTQSLLDLGVISTVAVLDFDQANFQKITTANSINLSFRNWPTSTGFGALGYGVMRVWIDVTDIGHVVTLPSSVNIAVSDIAGYDPVTRSLTFDQPGNYIFDFSSVDGGNNYIICDATRNRTTFRDQYLYYNRLTNPGLFVGFGPALQKTIAIADSDQRLGYDTVYAFGSINSVSAGNLSMANQINSALDTGSLAGYTISSCRGNLITDVPATVHSGDFLGYVNAQTYTGDRTGTGNAFQQISSISFFATGSNVNYGLGGNIAFFTMPDGAGAINHIQQALSINADQSVEVLGMFKTDGGISAAGTKIYSVPLTAAPPVKLDLSTSALVLDSVNSRIIDTVTIQLPVIPQDKQQIRISSVAPITTANIYAANGVAIKYVQSNYFAQGNVGLQLIYNAANSTWYRS